MQESAERAGAQGLRMVVEISGTGLADVDVIPAVVVSGAWVLQLPSRGLTERTVRMFALQLERLALWRRATSRRQKVSSASSLETLGEEASRGACYLAAMPESLVDEVLYFLVAVQDVGSVACCGRALWLRASARSVRSEVARLGFSHGRGRELRRHDAAGESCDSVSRHVSSWPWTLSTWGAHGDISTTLTGDGLVHLRFRADCKPRSNRCVAGDRRLGAFGKAPSLVPGLRKGRQVWRASSGAYFEVELATTEHSRPIDSRKPTTTRARVHNSARPCVAVGLCTSAFGLRGKQPGWDANSWAYHADDGLRFHRRGVGMDYGLPFVAGDVVGCGCFKFRKGQGAAVFYTCNGRLVDDAPAFVLPQTALADLFPVIGMDTNRLQCEVNFGISKPFVFDLDAFLAAAPALLKAPPARKHLAPTRSLRTTDVIVVSSDDDEDDEDDGGDEEDNFVPGETI